MPSINTLLAGLALTSLSIFQVCSAVPTPQVARRPALPARGTPTLPLAVGATSLPAPTTSFVSVALGRGIQNYTCSAVGATPVAIGAIATLYDMTALACSNIAQLHALSASAVNTPAPRDPFTQPFSLPAPYNRIPSTGKHIFIADGTPNFVLSNLSKSILAKKNASVTAPATASKGPSGTGAVDWLQLIAKPAPYVSVGLSTVYRVETAGGVQGPCTSVGIQSVQYAAEYWFYA
ncbi:hypothetical protein B0O99DRAFT_680375 [Bisporella sp. PMI_857]|nr:hypothetical protein B0O99DRAFT_680375 [Bisporella sp. PMI_857]